MNEYGGYLAIDSMGEEYFLNIGIKEEFITRLNAARYGIVEAIKDSGCKRIWVPVYICHTVLDVLEDEGIVYNKYNIGEDFMPDMQEIGCNDIILVTNYYGIKQEGFYYSIIDRYRNVIFDNTQAFFTKPIIRNGIYNIYSPRKFVGVPDGAYVITNHKLKIEKYEQDVSYNYAQYLFKAIEIGTNSAYLDYLRNEDRLCEDGPKQMSKLTRHLLANIDYDKIRHIRKKNYHYLVERLSNNNQLKGLELVDDPMVYPLLIKENSSTLRKKLVENKIYVPQWWKWVVESNESNQFEKFLSNNIIPIPIDQRYGIEDMSTIVDIIQNNLMTSKNV